MLRDISREPTSAELDKAVNDSVNEDLDGVLELVTTLHFRILLAAVIEHSNNVLDNTYFVPEKAKRLLNDDKVLRKKLAGAWKVKKYEDIRNYDVLRAPQAKRCTTQQDVIAKELHEHLWQSFQLEYRGVAADGFHEYLTHNEAIFNTARNPRYYAKFCSVVQSSGTGKSRMLTQLTTKDVVVIYMNLRDKTDNLSFPERDDIPSNILTEFPATASSYEFVCCTFFTALFDVLQETFSAHRAMGNAKAALMAWANQMVNMNDRSPTSVARVDFFRKVGEKYKKICDEIEHAYGDSAEASSTTSVSQTTDQLARLSLSGKERPQKPEIKGRLFTSHQVMAESLNVILGGTLDQPKLVIVLDEAHPLSPTIGNTSTNSYRPANVLCRTINEYSHDHHYPIWVVFASTTSKVSDFCPPNNKHNSARVSQRGEKLFPPYTQLGWDQGATGLLEGSELEKVSSAGYIAGFGRPLWLSLKKICQHPYKVLDLASYKLCGAADFAPQDSKHVLAVLGQRFGLNVVFGHPDSVEHLEDGVASHLRICIGTTMERTWRFTNYPSEPFLSCAAAMTLHAGPRLLDEALGALLKEVNSGMIDMGQRGELASRLLWLLAKDLFLRRAGDLKDKIPSTWDEPLPDCQMIPVVDWLEFIFGKSVWGSVFAREAFKDAYVNFSHWVCMKVNIAGSGKQNAISLEEWTQRHWQRTSAIQCCHQQPLIDKVIPIYFKNAPSGKMRMSHIFISDKARESKDSKSELGNITRRDKSIGGSDGPLPYIAILADLGQDSKFSVTFPERGILDRCLRIYAGGADVETYEFLAQCRGLMKMLKDLVHLQRIPKTDRPFAEYLGQQVEFGSTPTEEHMHWERSASGLEDTRL